MSARGATSPSHLNSLEASACRADCGAAARIGAGPTSARGPASPYCLSSLEAIRQKLEEDRSRGCERAAGGAVRAASFLRAVGRASPAEVPAAAAREQPAVEAKPLTVEDAVTPPRLAAPPASPPRQDGAQSRPPTRPFPATATARPDVGPAGAGPCPPGGADMLAFESDRGNFTHILRFLKHRAAWEPPKTLQERAALRTEALYFGCAALVQRLDELDEDAGRFEHTAAFAGFASRAG